MTDWKKEHGGVSGYDPAGTFHAVRWDSQDSNNVGYAYVTRTFSGTESGELSAETLEGAIAEYEGMLPVEQIDELKEAARKAIGMYYESAEARAIMNDEDWQDYFPEVDGRGEYTGGVIDIDDDNYIIIGEDVMIDKYSLNDDELRRLRAGEFPVWD